MDFLSLLTNAVGDQEQSALADQLGMSPDKTNTLVSTALPLLTGALAQNAQQGSGASALEAALDKDHDGSILDDVAGFMARGDMHDGEGILRHALGGKQRGLEASLGNLNGIDAATAHKLLAFLAPLVMGALGKAKKSDNLDASGIASLLTGAKDQLAAKQPESASLLTMMLDQDGDGDVKDDLLRMGMKKLKNLI